MGLLTCVLGTSCSDDMYSFAFTPYSVLYPHVFIAASGGILELHRIKEGLPAFLLTRIELSAASAFCNV
jgi:hypothetical protein